MKNKFNRLTSKEWLPFQKSWCRFTTRKEMYENNIRFFTKAEVTAEKFYYSGAHLQQAKTICKKNNIQFSNKITNCQYQFALFDLLDAIKTNTSFEEYKKIRTGLLKKANAIFPLLTERRFISVFIPNIQNKENYFPFAWDVAFAISKIYSLKDEKIVCIEDAHPAKKNKNYFSPGKKVFYCLYFRKDENSENKLNEHNENLFFNTRQPLSAHFERTLPAWFILKPPPRNKNEILHPAKFPEALGKMFIETFSHEHENIFDPMSGTGSTQLSALQLNRNGYGTELSRFFAHIAIMRCTYFIKNNHTKNKFSLLVKDARKIKEKDFPCIDYVITSPPYWDMLNMKGAEYQARRKEKGLQTNYSDDKNDLGNMHEYAEFVNALTEIYFNIIKLLRPGAYITIVVKNIKKKGKNYPLAWHLAEKLQQQLILLPEVFWCQDDISIAPFGYGNTWVSNTFHQYCLTFQKPS